MRRMMMQAEEDDINRVQNDQTSLHAYNQNQNLTVYGKLENGG